MVETSESDTDDGKNPKHYGNFEESPVKSMKMAYSSLWEDTPVSLVLLKIIFIERNTQIKASFSFSQVFIKKGRRGEEDKECG